MDPIRENFELRWNATAPGWRLALLACMAGFLASLVVPPVAHPGWAIAVLRAALFSATLLAIAVNKRVADDFYKQVYTQASVFSLMASAIVFFVRSQFAFGGELTSTASILVLVVTWWLGYVLAFVRLRRM